MSVDWDLPLDKDGNIVPMSHEQILEDMINMLTRTTGLPRRVYLGNISELTPDEIDHFRRVNGLDR